MGSQCDTCLGTGVVDDAEPGDISFNTYPCPDCKGAKTMKLIIAGSRSFDDYDLLRNVITRMYPNPYMDIEQVVSGTARGADRVGEQFAERFGIELKRFPADWKRWGKSAGAIRNAEMAEYADALIAFWDGESKGTQHMIKVATKKGLEVSVINYKEKDE